MRRKMSKIIMAAAVLIMAACPVAQALSGGGECGGRRPLSASEQSGFLDAMRTIRSAMPPAPEGWTTQELDPGGNAPASICETPGVPLESVYQVSYTNEKKILESIQKFERSKSAGRMERLAEEMSDAAEKGDSKKLQKLQEELDGLNATPAGRMTARILVRSNPVKTAGIIRGGSEFTVPGAKYAYLTDDKKGKKLVLYLGRWNRRGEYGIYPEIVKERSNASVQIIEVIIEGDLAEQLAKTMNLKVLNLLIQ
jgi:hypothetical protein